MRITMKTVLGLKGDYQDPWKDDAGVMRIGVIPFLLDKTLLEK